jgi:hypothetical protein
MDDCRRQRRGADGRGDGGRDRDQTGRDNRVQRLEPVTDGAVLGNFRNRARRADSVRALVVLDEHRLTVRVVGVRERDERDRHAAAHDEQRDQRRDARVPKQPEHLVESSAVSCVVNAGDHFGYTPPRVTNHRGSSIVSALALVCALVGGACQESVSPAQPAPSVPPSAKVLSFEAEIGTGDGHLVERSRASGGLTVHLGPGERRAWTFKVGASPLRYAFAVTYANGKEGENDVISVSVDGVPVTSFLDRDSGDAVEGWNAFVTYAAGSSTLGAGAHTLTLAVSGGDGCVEIDFVTLTAVDGGGSQEAS